jgi:hypothetical protein
MPAWQQQQQQQQQQQKQGSPSAMSAQVIKRNM